MVDLFLRQSGNIPAKTFETSNVEVIKQSVMCELGISILPYIVVQEICQKEQLCFSAYRNSIRYSKSCNLS